ncbi:lipopolysaccharide biosynthesis protein [Caulobacter sp. UNC358MFTsu5.1]|uniref:lipopolysaccharide biosynthesis protein n=1 Tax=Caulobacter sp. UNC358MFTsu5.1 TaxID=1449049 RepID=UPI0004A76E4B|nr:lipopolysaccharide biosynthesis protein [Caulobacter sp. UNC358MFTsu5.1]
MIIKSTVLYAPAIMAPRAAAFILVLLLTRRLGPAEFGLYALVTLVGEMLDMGSSNWIRFSLLRSDISTPAVWRDGLVKSARLSVAFMSLACLVGLGVAYWIAPGRALTFAVAVAAYVVSNSALRLGLATLQLQGRKLEQSALETARAAGLLCSGWIASGLHPDFASVALANAAVTGAFAAIVLTRGALTLPAGGAVGASYRSRIEYGLPIVALTFVSYMVASSDRVFLKLLGGAASVGIYAASYSIARTPSDIIGNAMNQGGFPELMRRHDQAGVDGAAQFVRNAFELMTVLQFTVLGFSAGLSHAIANAVLPPAYRDAAIHLLPIITAGAVCISLKAYVFDNIFHATRKNWLQFSTYAPAGLVTVAASLLLIPRLGALGAALSFLLGSFCGLMSSYLLSRRFINARLNMVELAKAVALGVIGGGVGHLTWMALPAHLPALAVFAAAATAGLTVWAVAAVLLRPKLIRGPVDKLTRKLLKRAPAQA